MAEPWNGNPLCGYRRASAKPGITSLATTWPISWQKVATKSRLLSPAADSAASVAISTYPPRNEDSLFTVIEPESDSGESTLSVGDEEVCMVTRIA